MKTIFLKLLAVMLLFFSAFAYAQMGGNPQERMKANLEELKTRLNLTDEQYSKVETILKEQNDEMAKLRESSGGNFQSMRGAFTELREKTDKKIEELLTEEQKPEYKKMIEERAYHKGAWKNRIPKELSLIYAKEKV